MTEARIWYARHMEQPTLPGDCRNVIVLSSEFFREIMEHPIPTSKPPKHSHALQRHWTCSHGCRTVASLQSTRSGYRCSAPAAWRTNLEVQCGPPLPACSLGDQSHTR
jgi:hypothetical protein